MQDILKMNRSDKGFERFVKDHQIVISLGARKRERMIQSDKLKPKSRENKNNIITLGGVDGQTMKW